MLTLRAEMVACAGLTSCLWECERDLKPSALAALASVVSGYPELAVVHESTLTQLLLSSCQEEDRDPTTESSAFRVMCKVVPFLNAKTSEHMLVRPMCLSIVCKALAGQMHILLAMTFSVSRDLLI